MPPAKKIKKCKSYSVDYWREILPKIQAFLDGKTVKLEGCEDDEDDDLEGVNIATCGTRPINFHECYAEDVIVLDDLKWRPINGDEAFAMIGQTIRATHPHENEPLGGMILSAYPDGSVDVSGFQSRLSAAALLNQFVDEDQKKIGVHSASPNY